MLIVLAFIFAIAGLVFGVAGLAGRDQSASNVGAGLALVACLLVLLA